MTSEATMVLLHGAGTGAWVWKRVEDELTVPAVALELDARSEGASPEGVATALVDRIDSAGAGDVVLVLHSLAGVLAADLSERLGPRLRRIVFVSAVIPPPGGSFVDAMGFPGKLILRLLFRLNPRGLKPSEAMIRRELCNDLSEADADLVVERYQAEMPGLYLSPVRTSWRLPPCEYVRLTLDRSVSPAQQARMIARLSEPRTHDLPAGHLAMLSRPGELAQVLTGAAV